MILLANIHPRRSIRLKGYDYAQAGAYFVTICTQGRACLLGDVVDGDIRLNDAGRMIESVWNDLPTFYPGVATDEFVVMPNHVHGIIVIVGAAPQRLVGAAPRGRPDSDDRPYSGQPQGVAPTLSLPDVVHRFKTMTTKRYANGVKQSGWSPFAGRLWQRNYYEHIIRDGQDLDSIREYIVNNPLQWALDQENPLNARP
ncbi:MAG: transposase [Deltaproteobacteria bacterium]|nr:transposase [Deltaproteobacteria bacterium]